MIRKGTKLKLRNGGRKLSKGNNPGTMTETKFVQWYEDEIKRDFDLTTHQFKLILTTFFRHFKQALVSTGYRYKLPSRFGAMTIAKQKTSGKSKKVINWKETKAQGRHVYYKNRHSSDFFAKLVWDKNHHYCGIGNKPLFKFKTVRPMKKLISEEILNNNRIEDYYEISHVRYKEWITDPDMKNGKAYNLLYKNRN